MIIKWRINVASSPDREYLVAEIFFGDTQWAEINQESQVLEVEFYPRPDGMPWRIPLRNAIAALGAAESELN